MYVTIYTGQVVDMYYSGYIIMSLIIQWRLVTDLELPACYIIINLGFSLLIGNFGLYRDSKESQVSIL